MRYYLIFFIFYEIAISFYFYNEYLQKVKFDHEKNISLVKSSFDAAINTFALANDNFHTQHSQALSILVTKANDAPLKVRNEIRQKLLTEFMNFYSDKKLDSFGGMQIFDKEGYSLLRFHKPKFYDDAIILRRKSLQNMKKNFMYKNGFEIGVFDVTYRFQYPLFYDGTFVGSYEYSLDYDAILKEMHKFYADEYLLLLDANRVDSTMKAEMISKKYLEIFIGDKKFYFTKASHKNSFDLDEMKYLAKAHKLGELVKSLQANVYDYSYGGNKYSLVVYPIKDINQDDIGYMLASILQLNPENFIIDLIMKILFTTLLSLIAYVYFLKQIRHKAYVRNLLNLQQDMLLVTDGTEIKDANKAFLDFFSFDNVREFKKVHHCICDFFVNEEGFLRKEQDGLSWLEYMKRYPSKEHKVKIINPKTLESIIFEIEMETMNEKNRNFIVFRDITDRYYKSKELENRANYDALTHIYNRASFEKELHKELEKASRYGTEFSLIMFDVDFFKNVNDNYGHDVGDDVLQKIAHIVHKAIRDIDFFARWGGEEFMIISHGTSNESEVLAEKLREIISAYDFPVVKNVTCSFGIVQYHKGDTKESIVKRVDKMLYSAKEAGRNCVVTLH